MKLALKRWPAPPLTPPDRPRLLLLHGLGGGGSLWRPLAAAVEDHLTVLSPDQRGHGQSQIKPGPADYTPLDYGQDLVDTLAAETAHPAWAVGHSMGVRSALALAHLKPHWVEGLVLIDLGLGGSSGGGLGDPLAEFLFHLPQEFTTGLELNTYLQTHSPDASIGRYLAAVAKPGAGGAWHFPFDQEALIQTIEGARHFPGRQWLKDFAQTGKPVFVLRGETSQVWSKEEFIAERGHFAEYPHVRFEEFAGTGHGLPFEKRTQLAELILRQILKRGA